MLLHKVGIAFVGDDVNVFFRADFLKAAIGFLDERFAIAEDVDKLFWGVRAAERPETCAHAACHDDTIKVFIHYKKAVAK